MLLRQLEYLTALARERHFARAAEACDVSQPALSAAIRKLESELDVPIVLRGNRFEGFTPEGERVLRWAYRILSERDGLTEDVGTMRKGLTGRLRIGAIPTTLTTLPLLTVPFCEEHPQASLSVLSLSSANIQRRLAEFEIDAGVTYLGGQRPAHLRAHHLYQEPVQQPREPDGLIGQAGPVQPQPRAGGVPLVGDEVEDVQNHTEPLGPLRLRRRLEARPGIFDALLGPADALGNRRLGHQKRGGNLGGRQAADGVSANWDGGDSAGWQHRKSSASVSSWWASGWSAL
jgi:hypothetical protein